jgi:hypothetical protein
MNKKNLLDRLIGRICLYFYIITYGVMGVLSNILPEPTCVCNFYTEETGSHCFLDNLDIHVISSLFVVVHRSISTCSTLVTHDNGSFSLFFDKKFLLTKCKAFCRYANVAKT